MSGKRSFSETLSQESNRADGESDDDFGPMPAEDESSTNQNTTNSINESTKANQENKKPRKSGLSPYLQTLYLDNLPKSSFYEKSYMHRDVVTHIVVSKLTEFIITASCDGHVKFWKKMKDSIEFVKHYQAHLGKINSVVLSPDEARLITTAEDKMIKFFEIIGFDMSYMISVPFNPTAAAWLKSGAAFRIAVADANSGDIRIYRTEDGGGNMSEPFKTLSNLHQVTVKSIVFNPKYSCCVSIDQRGMIEYWDTQTCQLPTQGLKFEFKSETDLYDIAKSKTIVSSATISPSGDLLAVVAADKIIRVFDFASGKLRRKYDESVKVYKNPSQQVAVGGLDSLEMGRREAIERDLESSPDALALCNAIFDETSNFLIYGSLLGVKVINIADSSVVRTIGLGEAGGERFLCLALYQGIPKVDAQYLLSKVGADASSTVEQLQTAPLPDPTLFATSFKKRRFYCFSRREPNETADPRDVFNEKPTEEESTLAATDITNQAIGREAVLHTPLGDIEIRLFGSECPKTVENFCTHARNGYYNNTIFHRVIRGFMIQTGDPRGDGTGGESIWGGEFEDEFVKTLKHDRPFTVSMANIGPNTNGSQFFITTVPTPWLDNKHTVFGRVTRGFQVVTSIENAKVAKHDRPVEEIKIISIDIKK